MATIDDVRDYWDRHIHDLEITQHPVGSRGFFDDLDQYHFEKLHHLLRLVDFDGYRGPIGSRSRLRRRRRPRAVRERRRDRHRRRSRASAIELARANFAQQGLQRRLSRSPTASACRFPTTRFDLVYAHGVVQYTADPQRLVDECRRVLKPGGEAIFQVYNRDLVAERAVEADEGRPRARRCAGAAEVQHRRVPAAAVAASARSGSCPSAFPVKSRLHGGWKGAVYNGLFVGTFNAAAAGARPPLRLAPAGVLPQMMPTFIAKAHAYGNDFLYVRGATSRGARRSTRSRASCATGTPASAPTG